MENTDFPSYYSEYLKQTDPFAVYIVNAIKNKLGDPYYSPTNPAEPIKQLLFGKKAISQKDFMAVQAKFDKNGGSFKPICGKILGMNDVYIRCLDCERPYDNPYLFPVLCRDCYEKGNHKGHRVIISRNDQNGEGSCDCGDIGAYPEHAFCTDHHGYNKDKYEQIWKSFPQDTVEVIVKTLTSAFYGLFVTLEIFYREVYQQDSNDVFSYLEFTDKLANEVCELLAVCCHINSNLILLINWFWKSKTHNLYLCHDCDDLLKFTCVGDAKPCKCSMLENIFRYSAFFSFEVQSSIKTGLIDSFTDFEFRPYLVETYTKMNYFFYCFELINEQEIITKINALLEFPVQLFAVEVFCTQVVDSPLFSNILYTVDKALDACLEKGFAGININNFYHTMKHIDYLIRGEVSLKLIKKEEVLVRLFELLRLIHIKNAYQAEDILSTDTSRSLRSNLFYVELNIKTSLEDIIIKGAAHIVKEEERLAVIESIGLALKNKILAIKQNKAGLAKGKRFHTSLHRQTCLLYRTYSKRLNKNSVAQFFKEAFKLQEENGELGAFAKKLLKAAFSGKGLMAFAGAADVNFGFSNYFHSSYACFDYDTLLAQLSITAVDPKNLFNHLVNAFIKFDSISEVYLALIKLNPDGFGTLGDDTQAIAHIKEFLQYCLSVMLNELPYFSIYTRRSSEDFTNNKELAALRERILTRFFVTLLQQHYFVTVQKVKEEANLYIDENIQIDDIFLKICDIDNKTKKIRLKDQFKSYYEPFIFSHHGKYMNDLVNNLKSKHNSDVQFDVFDCGKDDELLSIDYLYDVQKAFFQSEYANFLAMIVIQIDKVSTFEAVLPEVLKSILLHLRLALLAIQKKETSSLVVLNAKKFYLDEQKLGKILEGWVSSSKLKNSSYCPYNTVPLATKVIEYLTDLYTALEFPLSPLIHPKKQEQVNVVIQVEAIPTKESDIEENKALNGKVKEETKKKLSAPALHKQHSQDAVICVYCLDEIDLKDTTQDFGVPVCLTRTNISQYMNRSPEDFKYIDDKHDALKISSCFHYLHTECYVGIVTNQPGVKWILSESECPTCKAYFNFFLPFNKVPEVDYLTIITDMIKAAYMINNEEFSIQSWKVSLDFLQFSLIDLLQTSSALGYPKFLHRDHLLYSKLFTQVFFFIDSYREQFLMEAPLKEGELSGFYTSLFKTKLPEFPTVYETIGLPTENDTIIANLDIKEEHSDEIFISQYSSGIYSAFELLPLVETDLETLYCDLLWDQKIVSLLDTHVKLFDKTKTLIQDYLLAKSIQSYCFTLITSDRKTVSLKDFGFPMLLTSLKEGSPFYDVTIRQILDACRKVVLSTALIKSPQEYSTNYLTIQEEINAVFKMVNTKEEGKEETVMQLQDLTTQDFWDKHSGAALYGSYLLTVFKYLFDNPHERFTKMAINSVHGLQPFTFKFPANYLLYNTQHVHTKCSLCGSYSTGKTAICLICSESFCVGFCQGNFHSNTSLKGNLMNHSREKHFEIGLFVTTQMPVGLMIHSTHAVRCPQSLYINAFGEGVEDTLKNDAVDAESKDWTVFKINGEFVEYVKDALVNNKIQQEVYNISKNKDYQKKGFVLNANVL